MYKKSLTIIILLILISAVFIYAEEGKSGDTLDSVSQSVSQSAERQNFNKWILNDTRGKRYSDYRQYFNELFDAASKQNIPAALLINKIHEGAAKNIPPQRLIKAVSNELIRLETAKYILDNEKITPKDYGYYEDTLKHISILLLGGIESKTIIRLLKLKDKYSRTADDILTACDVLIQFNSIDRLSQGDLYSTGRALLMSRLKSASFSSIASIYLNARAKRIKTGDILKIIETTLENGGGLIQIDREISDRGRNR